MGTSSIITGLINQSDLGFGPAIEVVFAEVPYAEPDDPTALNFASMYMSADGEDPLAGAPSGHANVPARKARENAALKPNTDYYLSWLVLSQGHPSWVPKTKIDYRGTDSADDKVIASAGIPMFNPMDGKPGIFVPD